MIILTVVVVGLLGVVLGFTVGFDMSKEKHYNQGWQNAVTYHEALKNAQELPDWIE